MCPYHVKLTSLFNLDLMIAIHVIIYQVPVILSFRKFLLLLCSSRGVARQKELLGYMQHGHTNIIVW